MIVNCETCYFCFDLACMAESWARRLSLYLACKPFPGLCACTRTGRWCASVVAIRPLSVHYEPSRQAQPDQQLKPVLNWVNVSSRTWLEVFVEAIFGSKKLRSTCSGDIRHIRRSLPLTGWEQSSPVDEEKIKMDDGVARFFTRFGGNMFICWLVGGAALSRRPEWDSS